MRPNIQAIGAKWIAELRLQDRIITIRYTKNLSDSFGNLVYGLMTIQNLDEGRFLIEVQDPDTWPSGGSRQLSAESIEEGIVHELVHVRWIDLTAHNPDPAALVQEERATWATARALVRANSSTRAAMVRAMMVNQAATRRQTQGRNMAMDPATAKMLLDASESEDAAAMKKAIRKIVEDALSGGDGPPSASEPAAPPLGADVGNDVNKDKPPMNMGDKPEQYARAMKADAEKSRALVAEIEAAAALLRPQAKAELVRGMRADGIELTPHQEKLVLDSKTIDEAKTLVAGMRAMAPAGSRKPTVVPSVNGAAGLTRAQAVKYERMVAAGNPRADSYRDECARENAKKGGAK